MALPIIVIMKARVWTDGNPKDLRDRTLRVAMDPDLIRNAVSLDEAIAAFKQHAPHLNEVLSFDFFEIMKIRYEKEYWTGSGKARRV